MPLAAHPGGTLGWTPWCWGWGWGLHAPSSAARRRQEGQTGVGGRFSLLKGGEEQCKQQADQFFAAFKVLSHLRNKHKGQNH